MSWRDVPVPRRMQALCRDRRGYPIPFVVLRNMDGDPHFTVNDARRQLRAMLELRCGICGSRMKKPYWFVGGPLSAFHKDGAYVDSALHRDCMAYALQVCPYLAMPNWARRIDDATVDYDRLKPENRILVDPTMIPERPGLFVAVGANSQTIIQRPPLHQIVKPDRPYVAVEYWQHGVRLSDEQGAALAAAAVEEAACRTL